MPVHALTSRLGAAVPWTPQHPTPSCISPLRILYRQKEFLSGLAYIIHSAGALSWRPIISVYHATAGLVGP